MHKERGKHNIIWYEVAREITFTASYREKLNVKLLLTIFIQGKNISRKLCGHKNILP